MQTRKDVTRELREQLGPVATRDDAERLFQYLYDRDLIEWDVEYGYRLGLEVDTIDAFLAMDREVAS